VILTCFSVPVAFVWSCSSYILQYGLGIEADIAHLAGIWSKYLLLGLWPSLVFQILKKFLQGCGIVWPTLTANVLAAVSNVVLNYVLVEVYHMGYIGAVLTVVISQWISLLSLSLIICIQIFCFV
jgi:multidrug resistance protein, MATE family